MVRKYCAKCGKQLVDDSKLCPGCGAPIDSQQELAADKGGEFVWEAECKAADYKPLFTLPKAVLGFFFPIALFAVNFGIWGNAALAEKIAPNIVVVTFFAAAYVAARFVIIKNRNSVFRGKFTITDTEIRVLEILPPPKGALLETVNKEPIVDEEYDPRYYRVIKNKGINQITTSDDNSMIFLKKKIGHTVLLVKPEDCSRIIAEIKNRQAL